MQPLTRGEIELIVKQAGFTGVDADIAVAIALAESGGDPAAYNPETAANAPDGLGSIGLFQIFKWRHPEFCAWDLTQPVLNARVAYFLYVNAGRKFTPWATFTEGKYKQFLQPSMFAVADPDLGQ